MPQRERKHQQRANANPDQKKTYQQWPFYVCEGAAAASLAVGYMLSNSTHKIAATWVFFTAVVLGAMGVAIRLTQEFSKSPETPETTVAARA
jgi:hypothetical protein